MSITWLADVLRAERLTVVEYADWKTHDRPGEWKPQYGVVHATAAPRSQKDATQIGIVRNGRSDLKGPIANACVDRLGRWWTISAGRCNTTLTGTSGPFEGKGNTYALGVEACNDNRGEPWPARQYESYYRGWSAICRRMGWTAQNLVGHKEHTPGHKSDPTFNMDEFRANVSRSLTGDDDMEQALHDALTAILTGQGSRSFGRSNNLHVKLNGLYAAIMNVDEELLAKIGSTPAHQAEMLRVLLGDNAQEVGRILAEG